jgi:hypothetical protein
MAAFSPSRSWLPGAARAAVIGLAAPLSAQAALPFGALDFVQRVATVLPTDIIEVRMRLTLDPASPPLLFSSDPLTGFAPEDLPTEGQFFNPDTQQNETRPVASISGAYLNTYFGCSDTFTGGCNGNVSNYSYQFFLSSQPGSPSINFRDSFDLAPGASYEYVFATFTPAVGGAAPGTYLFYSTGVTLNFRAFDAAGNFLSTPSRDIGYTCAGGNTPECAFTRVVEVPEPATWGLLGLGLFVVGGAAARRRRPSA